jgi:hypothetical protein
VELDHHLEENGVCEGWNKGTWLATLAAATATENSASGVVVLLVAASNGLGLASLDTTR